jgi:dGTPase
LPENEPPGFILKVLKEYCQQEVYTHESVQRLELAGYNAIKGLLGECERLLKCSRSRFDAARAGQRKDAAGQDIVLEPKLLKLFPPKYLRVYEDHRQSIDGTQDELQREWNARAHLVVDYISGMTDDFAMTTYRTLAGMRL